MVGKLKLKAAVIGLGRIGFEFGRDKKRSYPASHYHCYRELFGRHRLEDIAVCDSNKAKLVGFLGDNVFDDYHEMLRKFKPDIVSICTPTPTHATIACEVASSPSVKTIFLEKPIADSIQSADAIIAVCESNNVKLVINHTRRWDHAYSDLWESKTWWHTIWSSGATFEIIEMLGIHHGPLLRTGIHMIDLFNWFARSKPIWAQALYPSKANYLKTDDRNISGMITYENGIQALLMSGTQKPYVLFEFDLLSKEGRIRVTRNGLQIETFTSKPSSRYQGLEELYPFAKLTRPSENSLLFAIEEITQTAFNRCPGAEARNALKVALALHYSASHFYPLVRIDEVPENYSVKSH